MLLAKYNLSILVGRRHPVINLSLRAASTCFAWPDLPHMAHPYSAVEKLSAKPVVLKRLKIIDDLKLEIRRQNISIMASSSEPCNSSFENDRIKNN